MGAVFMEHQASCRVAVVQVGSVVMDGEASVEKAVHYIKEAGSNGANIIVFPEAFIPAYPRGMSFGAVVGSRSEEGREDFALYADHAVVVPSAATDLLAKAAKEAEAYVVIGVIEKEAHTKGGTLYCTVLFFGPDGTYLGKHRKLKPTGSERLIWGEGDGSTLPVFETPYGRIGALICWENYMPLARTAMYEQGIDIYIAPTADARKRWLASMQHIALEGRCFVLSCNQYSIKADYPKHIRERAEFAELPEELSGGGSCIINPLGEYIVEPVFGREDILYAELDMNEVTKARYDFDPVGHYSRPDLFQLIVNEAKQKNIIWKRIDNY